MNKIKNFLALIMLLFGLIGTSFSADELENYKYTGAVRPMENVVIDTYNLTVTQTIGMILTVNGFAMAIFSN